MNRLQHRARYGAINDSEIVDDFAPPAVSTTAKRLRGAVTARLSAQAAWREAKDAHDFEIETIAERIGAAVAKGEAPPADRTQELAEVLRAAAVQQDAMAKVSRDLEDEHAAAIVENRAAWDEALTSEIEKRKLAVAAHCDAIDTELAAIDGLQATRKLAADTQPGMLMRLRGGSWSADAKKGVAAVRRWLNPPARPKSNVVGRNIIGYEPNVMRLGEGELGREDF